MQTYQSITSNNCHILIIYIVLFLFYFAQKLYESQSREIVDKDKQIADLTKDLTAKTNLAEVQSFKYLKT